MLTIGSFHLPSVLLSLGTWGSLYLTLRGCEPRRKAEWHCRSVTVVHALLISLLTGWACLVQGPWPFTDAGGPNTPLQVTATTICLGYFLFDFAWCLYFQTEGFSMLLHHTLSIVGLSWILLAGRYGTEMMATVCGSEVTNPLLQLRWFLRETGRYHSVLGEVVDVTFMVSFFVLRIGMGSVLLYFYFQQPTDFWGRLGATSIYLIGWMFWISIFRYAVRKYTKKYRAWQKSKVESPSSPVVANGGSGSASDTSFSKDSLTSSSSSSSQEPRDEILNSGVNCDKREGGVSDTVIVSKNGVRHRSSNGELHAASNGTLAPDKKSVPGTS